MICNTCAVSMKAGQQRRRQRLSLLKKQRKLTNVSEHSVRESSDLTQQRVLKEGFMKKRGVWSRALKRRYFVLFENRRLHYYGDCKNGVATDERGVADLGDIESVSKKHETGVEVVTALRDWVFECESKQERDAWSAVFESLM